MFSHSVGIDTIHAVSQGFIREFKALKITYGYGGFCKQGFSSFNSFLVL